MNCFIKLKVITHSLTSPFPSLTPLYLPHPFLPLPPSLTHPSSHSLPRQIKGYQEIQSSSNTTPSSLILIRRQFSEFSSRKISQSDSLLLEKYAYDKKYTREISSDEERKQYLREIILNFEKFKIHVGPTVAPFRNSKGDSVLHIAAKYLISLSLERMISLFLS